MMLQITPQHRILLAVKPVDFRRGIDGLKALCKEKLFNDSFSGIVFAFTNRMHTSVKLLVYDASGFWLCQKRFSRGKLACWPTGSNASVSLRACELMILLSQGHPVKAGLPEDWFSVFHAACVDSNKAKVFS
jgi:transposase